MRSAIGLYSHSAIDSVALFAPASRNGTAASQREDLHVMPEAWSFWRGKLNMKSGVLVQVMQCYQGCYVLLFLIWKVYSRVYFFIAFWWFWTDIHGVNVRISSARPISEVRWLQRTHRASLHRELVKPWMMGGTAPPLKVPPSTKTPSKGEVSKWLRVIRCFSQESFPHFLFGSCILKCMIFTHIYCAYVYTVHSNQCVNIYSYIVYMYELCRYIKKYFPFTWHNFLKIVGQSCRPVLGQVTGKTPRWCF